MASVIVVAKQTLCENIDIIFFKLLLALGLVLLTGNSFKFSPFMLIGVKVLALEGVDSSRYYLSGP